MRLRVLSSLLLTSLVLVTAVVHAQAPVSTASATPPPSAETPAAPPEASAAPIPAASSEPKPAPPVSSQASSTLPPRATAAPQPPPAPSPPPSAGWSRETWGYLALGAGALGLAGVAYAEARVSLINDDHGFNAYRSATLTGQDACTNADAGVAVPGAASVSNMRAMCKEGNTWTTVGIFVMLPLAVLGVASGVYLLSTNDADRTPPKASHLAVSPLLGRSSAAMQLQYSF